jgi:hypothetical protein
LQIAYCQLFTNFNLHHDYSIAMKIISREQIELTPEERQVLIGIRKRKFIFLASAYAALVVILSFIYITGNIKSVGISVERATRFRMATHVFAEVVFVVVTIAFVIAYIKTIHPYTRDLKKGMKTISWFYPSAYKTPYFDSFFLKTGSRKKPMLSINRDMWDAIRPGVLACILFAPTSRLVLSLDIDGHRMEFNEQNSDLEL